MTPDAMLDIIDVLEGVSFDDYGLFRQRQALVASLGIDERDVIARCGTLQVTRLAFNGRRFDIDAQAGELVPAGLIAALDEHEEWGDLIAWPIVDPSRMTTLLGAVAMLGEHQLDTASPWGPPLPVFRTATAWLRAGCVGVVPLDPIRAARAFLSFDGKLLAEDDAHGRELALTRAALVDRSPSILISDNVSATRAAA